MQVTVYRLICKGTIEERILQRAREKSKIQKIVISGGSFKPDTLKPTEVVSLLLDDEEIERKCMSSLLKSCVNNVSNVLYSYVLIDRQRQAEKKQQEVEREAERKRKHIGGSSTVRLITWFQQRPLTYFNFFNFHRLPMPSAPV